MLASTSLHRSLIRRLLAVSRTRLLATLLAAGVTTACGSTTTPPPVQQQIVVGGILINQGTFALEQGLHKQLTTTIKSSTGLPLEIPVVWRSSNDKVATVDVGGRVTAVDTGVAQITATSLGVTSQPVSAIIGQLVKAIDLSNFTPLTANSPGTSPDSLRVLVTNAINGGPLGGRKVSFAVTAGGGSVSPTSAVTNAQGIAQTAWTLGPAAGVNTVTATVLNGEDAVTAYVSPNFVTFSIRTYNALSAVAGDNQTGVILAKLPVDPSVKVVDSAGKPRAGIPVQFAATNGGRVATALVSTGADGVASPGAWTLGDVPGVQNLVAKVDNATVTLKATGTGTPIYYIARSVTAGQYVSCAINSDNTASCWGEQPKVGDSTSTDKSTPTLTKGDIKFTSLAANTDPLVAHVCGVAVDQALYCWGLQALTDTTNPPKLANNLVPTRYASDIKWTQAAPGQAHNCALATDQSVYCWGDNSVGQLGDRGSPTVKRYTPAAVFGGFKFQSVVSGAGHTCALATDGAAYCWGNNGNGQLGNGTTTQVSSPTAVSSGLVFKQLSTGNSFSCGITTTGQPYCWGNLGVGSSAVTVPRAYANAPVFTSISSGGLHSCALTSDGTPYCWGDNSAGQLGDSTTTFRANPTAVATTVKFKSISAGYAHSCGNALSGAVYCWGFNKSGELGDSTFARNTFRTQPRPIVLGVTPPSATAFRARR